MKLVTTKKTIKPMQEELRNSIWVHGNGKFFLPTHITGKWLLVDMSDCGNGYTGLNKGWDSVYEMYNVLGEQFTKLVPLKTLVLQSDDILDITQN
ncbi:hypothetical protein [Enterococcus phage Phi_Eg_SY1]|nr:hypothetical protein [Enterococcus phage Phi_Eg_SY1]